MRETGREEERMVSVFKHVPVPAMANSSVRQRLAASGVLPGVDVHWIKVVMMASSSLLLVRERGGFLAVGQVRPCRHLFLCASGKIHQTNAPSLS